MNDAECRRGIAESRFATNRRRSWITAGGSIICAVGLLACAYSKETPGPDYWGSASAGRRSEPSTGSGSPMVDSDLAAAAAAAAAAVSGSGGSGGKGASGVPARPQAGAGGATVVTEDDAGTPGSPSHAAATWFAGLNDAKEAVLGFQLPAPEALNDVTVRQIARVSLGGQAIRIHFSNEYGTAPLTFSKVVVAKSSRAAAIEPSTSTVVTFGGATSVTLQPKSKVWSDDILLAVEPRDDLAVSIYVPGSADISTEKRFAHRSNFVAYGDATSASDIEGFFETTEASYWMSEIVVLRSEPAQVVVAFGDSITEGFGSTPDADLRYPDQLSTLQLAGGAPGRPRSVVNAGISGNRWLHSGLGPEAVGRFARDALEVTGVRDVVIMMGINDIGFGVISESEAVTLEQLIAAISRAVQQARSAGLRVFLGTLPPFGGSFYFTEDGEKTRKALNTWILANKDVHAVIDFDRALRDPASPTTLNSRFDSGDQLHPNDTGYAAMAEAVSTALQR